jgi:hypothetical protein
LEGTVPVLTIAPPGLQNSLSMSITLSIRIDFTT